MLRLINMAESRRRKFLPTGENPADAFHRGHGLRLRAGKGSGAMKGTSK